MYLKNVLLILQSRAVVMLDVGDETIDNLIGNFL